MIRRSFKRCIGFKALIQELDSEIDEIENEIKIIMDEINSPILSIPGINYRMGAMIIAEIGDFNRFDSPDKILAYAGFSPSTYQSGQLDGAYAHIEAKPADLCYNFCT